MLCKTISLALIAVLLHGSVVAQVEPESPAQTRVKMQQVVQKAHEKNRTVKVTLTKKVDNRTKLNGKVSEIYETGFTLTEQKTGKATKLAYEDIQQVKQRGLSKGWKIALVVIAGVIVAAVIVSKPWQSE